MCHFLDDTRQTILKIYQESAKAAYCLSFGISPFVYIKRKVPEAFTRSVEGQWGTLRSPSTCAGRHARLRIAFNVTSPLPGLLSCWKADGPPVSFSEILPQSYSCFPEANTDKQVLFDPCWTNVGLMSSTLAQLWCSTGHFVLPVTARSFMISVTELSEHQSATYPILKWPTQAYNRSFNSV